MGSKNQPDRRGRHQGSPARHEQLWSAEDPEDLFDPDLAFEAARARLDRDLEVSEAPGSGLTSGSTPPDSGSRGDALGSSPDPVAVRDSEPPPPDDEISGELPVPALDDLEVEESEEAGSDTYIEPVDAACDADDPRFETADDPRIPTGRESFKIGEVAEIVGVRPYVLRYWESELDFVAPEKTEAGQRRFRRVDVATLLQVKRLRHDAGLTMAQTRTLIAEGRGSEVVPVADHVASPRIIRDADAQSRVRSQILRMREAVLDLLQAVEEEGEQGNG